MKAMLIILSTVVVLVLLVSHVIDTEFDWCTGRRSATVIINGREVKPICEKVSETSCECYSVVPVQQELGEPI